MFLAPQKCYCFNINVTICFCLRWTLKLINCFNCQKVQWTLQLKEKKILAIFSWFRFYRIKSNTFNCQVTFGPYLFIYFLTFRFCFPVFWISTSYPQYSLYNICKSLDGKREESLPALTAPQPSGCRSCSLWRHACQSNPLSAALP